MEFVFGLGIIFGTISLGLVMYGLLGERELDKAFAGAILAVIAIMLIVPSASTVFSDDNYIKTNTTIVFPSDLEYKSIDPSDNAYYAIGEDGSIYTLTQAQWAELDVPVIAETK